MNIHERALLLQKAEGDIELQQYLLRACELDIVYWFNTFCWTFDPRREQSDLPFELYEFQEPFVLSLADSIRKGENILVEKSRDMGISWIVLLTFQYFWLFHPGCNFHLGSRKEENVDKKGDISTLFEKLRYNLSWLPIWMKPRYEPKSHSLYMRLINPVNNNVITGESSNENFARGGRYKAILFDEFPFWPVADLAYASAVPASPCQVLVGTPYGKANRFARERFGGKIKVISLHWTQHPLKDEAWYEDQKKRMTKDEVARELDINYEHSVEGVVFGELTEHHVVKTPYQFDPYLNTIVAFDFGRTMVGLISQKDAYGRLHVFKEFIVDPVGKWGHKGENTPDLGRIVQGYLGDLDIKSRIDYVCDPAGNSPDHRTKTTDVLILEGMGFKPLLFEKAMKMKDRLKQGVSFIKKKLSERIGDQESILIYEPECPRLIEAFRSGYRYKQDHAGNITDTIEEEHPYEDVVDCLRYTLIEKFSIESKIEVPKRQPRRGNRYTGY
jgi:hypothetical protein